MITSLEQARKKSDAGLGKIRNYAEVVEYLDGLKTAEYSEASVRRMKELDQCLGGITSKVDTIVVGGTNGKSSTIHFAAKLLREEGFNVGTVLSSHMLNYNERIAHNFEAIAHKSFSDYVNDVINTAELNAIKATVHEIFIFASLLYFNAEKTDVVLIEVNYGGKYDATAYLTPKIAAVTRVAEDGKGLLGQDLDAMALELLEIGKAGTWFISAEQSKLRLQKMKTWCEERDMKWAMPIRKLASLPYVYEQLYGRIASLGERIAQIYVEDIKGRFSPFLRGNLLATQKGQRGRPTLEAKRQAELNPIKTLKGFWNEHFDLLHGRFELLDKENPNLLLDNANNLDALSNLFLGIRLVNYQKPIKGLALIMGMTKATNAIEAIKLTRYLLKKVPGHVFFIPLNESDLVAHDGQDLSVIAKELNVKAKACTSLADALEQAKATVDERDGLIAITGSNGIVREYWETRGIKKF
jgi:dihydrofolate synthase / folylpolyglutamate synthase